ncbi:MAG: hypothetical protein PWR03_1555, partial [Tenuifilum sp.]
APSDAMDKIRLPKRNNLFLPYISANFPIGTKKIAEESKNDIVTQLIVTAFRLNSCPIFGKARFMAEPIKGVIKEVNITSMRTIIASLRLF